MDGLPQAIEATPEAPEVGAVEQPQQAAQEPKQEGKYTARVDLSAIEDENIRNAIEGRFAHMSSLMKKQGQKHDRELDKWKRLAEDQARAMEELQGGMGAVVNHIQTQTFATTEQQLRAQLRQARDTGDTDAEMEILDRLAEVKVQKLAAPKLQPKKTETREQAFAGYRSGNEIAEEAAADGDLSPEELTVAKAWTEERGANGVLIRPWVKSANPDNPLSDPLFRRAQIEMAAVFEETSPYAHLPFEQKLAELDRRMGVQRQPNGQTVMSGNLTPRVKSSKVQLTDTQKRIAVRTKFAGPGKSNDDHYAAYRAQIERVNANKGAR